MKILYLIHVDWDWIFQRPQILELLIEKEFNCTVVSRNVFLSPKISNENIKPSKMIKVFQFPKEQKIRIIKYINNFLYNRTVRNWKDYDVIWVCYPLLFEYVPKNYKGIVIYDCMDNYVAMAQDSLKDIVRYWEQKLIKRSDLIFASSRKLMGSIPNLDNAILLRNGYLTQTIRPIQERNIKSTYKLGYIGTISSWFDFKLLANSLIKFHNIQYHLLGPIEKKIEFSIQSLSKNIIFEGVVEHQDLYDKIKKYDALIMPFIVNETILSVDPVKLYEYICFGKCIISVWYPEIERFRPFVYFYNNQEDFEKLIFKLLKSGFPPKYNSKQQIDFLNENTWEKRYELIKEKLNEFEIK